MEIQINRERLAKSFTDLCEIDSPSRSEAKVAEYLKKCFEELGADEILEDNSSKLTGSDTNNIVVRFNGTTGNQDSLFFAAHMDTVQPANNVKVQRDGDVFSSAGETILGGDDKSGIAPLIELIAILKENKIPHNPIELVFTTAEEIGLLGAKHFDASLLQSKMGYALDSTGINNIIIAAPAANKIKISIRGVAAHAGLNPEMGINALHIAAKAIAQLPLGRLDTDSTSNFGIIQGGVAQNIVPALVTIEGEVRSHDPQKLIQYTKQIADTFQQAVDEWDGILAEQGVRPSVDLQILNDYPAMNLDASHPVITKVQAAGIKIGEEQNFIVGGGGSDANIFNSFGIPTAILATGMNKVHTTDECCDLNDMVLLTKLIYTLVTTE